MQSLAEGDGAPDSPVAEGCQVTKSCSDLPDLVADLPDLSLYPPQSRAGLPKSFADLGNSQADWPKT